MTLAVVIPLLSLANWLGLGDSSKPQKAVDSAVAVIRVPGGGGSGFLAEIDGKKYIVTNQHVLMGAPAADVHITFSDGTEAHPTKPEIVGNLDLARIEIQTDRAGLKCANDNPAIDDPIQAVGNSLDAGVLTVGNGKIKGVGPNEIEVDCDFVPGNSGGPILDAGGNVLGVATYIRFGERDAATAGTRYTKNRRFAVRLRDGMAWIPISNWNVYAGIGTTIHDAEGLAEEVYIAAQAISENADLALFKPKSPKVVAAIADLDHLQQQLQKMSSSGPVTPAAARINQSKLAATYEGAFQKLRDACATTVRDINVRPIPKEWGWLIKQRNEAATQLQTLQSLLDANIKRAQSLQH